MSVINLFKADNIIIDPNGAPEGFVSQVEALVQKVQELHIGKRLLEEVAKAKTPVSIKYEKDCAGQVSNRTIELDLEKMVTYVDIDLQKHELPNFVRLAHELIHVLHHMTNTNCREENRTDRMIWTNDEEYSTIVGFTEDAITEHAFERELGIPLRLGHCDYTALSSGYFSDARITLYLFPFEHIAKMRLNQTAASLKQLRDPRGWWPNINVTVQNPGEFCIVTKTVEQKNMLRRAEPEFILNGTSIKEIFEDPNIACIEINEIEVVYRLTAEESAKLHWLLHPAIALNPATRNGIQREDSTKKADFRRATEPTPCTLL